MITFALFDPLRSTLMSFHNFADDKGGIEIAIGSGASLSYLGRSLKHFTFLLSSWSCWTKRMLPLVSARRDEKRVDDDDVDCVTGCDGWEDKN